MSIRIFVTIKSHEIYEGHKCIVMDTLTHVLNSTGLVEVQPFKEIEILSGGSCCARHAFTPITIDRRHLTDWIVQEYESSW
jgi:hypothetical protein